MDIKNILSLLTNYNLVIPEIQREYVWGDPKNKTVLGQFLGDVNDKVIHGDVNVGFLYSYKAGSEHYLIDGQQRYTTLLLLLHYFSLSEVSLKERFMSLLKLKEPIPAFSYRVRSATESFLSNLFQSNAGSSSEIKDQKWYKSEYAQDTTVVSMMGALDSFGELSARLSNLSFESVLNNVCFWYFDVEQTSQGEELYITMNSRGEKLTESEQIKPRLMNKISGILEKESYGKKWDDWEEDFFGKDLRKNRSVEDIDYAMNNLVRLVLEMVTLSEHNQLKPVEDAELIGIEDIERFMGAIERLMAVNGGKYRKEIERLYGDMDEDKNFFVLKALLVEILKGQKDEHEFERVYQSTINQVRRNKIKRHLDFLDFLDKYARSQKCFYDFILNPEMDNVPEIFTGHELEKIRICREANNPSVEEAIWKEQSSVHWNGDIKPLISWSKVDGVFIYSEFSRIAKVFNTLFNKNNGWTSDLVRQALITRRMPNYPNEAKFGYTDQEWKDIFALNSKEFLDFLNECDKADDFSALFDRMKESYPETPENHWAEFVHHNYLLEYCDTKHLYWNDQRGWMLVQRSWAQPMSVKDMNTYHYLRSYLGEKDLNGWRFDKYVNWDSCVYFQDNNGYFFDIRVMRREDGSYYYRIDLSKRCNEGQHVRLEDLFIFNPGAFVTVHFSATPHRVPSRADLVWRAF